MGNREWNKLLLCLKLKKQTEYSIIKWKKKLPPGGQKFYDEHVVGWLQQNSLAPPAHPNTLLQEGRARWELFQADPRIAPSPTSTFCTPTPLPNPNRAPKADVDHQSPTATRWWSPTSPPEWRIFANRLVNEQNKITRKKTILKYSSLWCSWIYPNSFNTF